MHAWFIAHVMLHEGALPEPVLQAVVLLGVPVGLLYASLALLGVVQVVSELLGDVLVISNDQLVAPLRVQIWLH